MSKYQAQKQADKINHAFRGIFKVRVVRSELNRNEWTVQEVTP